ncbi:MAG: serine/threonine-protein kinase [Bradymonadales bacterium]|jgi:serine/threonine protein kinase
MRKNYKLTKSELCEVLPTLIDTKIDTQIDMQLHEGVQRTLLGRYELEAELGRGGFGVVYLATQLGLGRKVAIKMMLKQRDNEEFAKRFVREVNIMKKLNHPNTVQIFDVGEDETGNLFYVMEYLEGGTLEDALRVERSFTMRRAVHITTQILRSLYEAHEMGVLHRDLKPANIFLRRIVGDSNFVKVLDFGLAKSLLQEPNSMLTEKGIVLGTPRYIAPEFFSTKNIGPHSDIYSLGLVLLHMLSGKNPIPENPMFAIQMHLKATAIPIPRELRKWRIGEILQKALAKDVGQRYTNCLEFLEALESIPAKDFVEDALNKEAERKRVISDRVMLPKLKKRNNKAVFAVLTLILLGLMLAVIILIWFEKKLPSYAWGAAMDASTCELIPT